MKKVKFIYNPFSGEKEILKYLDYIIHAYQKKGFVIIPYRLSFDSDITNIFGDIDETYDHILASGGDGTINQIVNLMKELNIDLMSMSSHKIYGPKGIGALYIRTGVKLHTFVHGGAQERRRRAGTENIPGIVGYAKACELAKANMDEHIKRLTELRTKLIDGILERIPHTKVNGSLKYRLPGNVNFSFEFIEGEGILLMLDMLGIGASSGSACTSGSLDT